MSQWVIVQRQSVIQPQGASSYESVGYRAAPAGITEDDTLVAVDTITDDDDDDSKNIMQMIMMIKE